jgi:hypothetical protein
LFGYALYIENFLKCVEVQQTVEPDHREAISEGHGVVSKSDWMSGEDREPSASITPRK